jgi:hypothetical protein
MLIIHSIFTLELEVDYVFNFTNFFLVLSELKVTKKRIKFTFDTIYS